ncbi:MAG: ParB/RepB/Spo0J family partition protein [Planctomycetes bacterium]|nr:ParB/RepB/Spo0J family partition protein [Planctomycetota bacterium]
MFRGRPSPIPPPNRRNRPPKVAAERVVPIPVDRIFQNPYQPRRIFRPEAIEGLAASVARHGVLVPILVSPIEQGYLLVCGERRLRASRLAGLKTIPAIVRELDAAQMLELALIENLHREPLTAVEEAETVSRLGTEHVTRTDAEVSAEFGLPLPAVTMAHRLTALPWLVKRAVIAGIVSPEQAIALGRVPGPQAQISCLAAVWARRLSLPDTIRLADAVRARLAS